MQTKEFLEHIWPELGPYIIAGKDQQNIVQPKFVNSIEEAEKVISNFLNDKQDVYFTMSSWLEADYDKGRKGINSKEQKAFWLDIDCGYDEKKRKWKDYRTKDDALKALREFTDATKFPAPTIVDSGNGIHCYWSLTDAVATDIWKPVANGFKFLCIKHKLNADHGCTADVSRILRVPGTKNFKDIDNPKDVVVLQKGDAISFDDVAGLVPVDLVDKRPKRQRELDPATKAILGNNSAKFKKIIDRCIIKDGCPQLEYIMLNQTKVEEPLWRSGLSIAGFCEDRDVAIHKISKLHPDYEYQKTIDKVELIPGPHTCKQFESQRPEGCRTCKHKGKITSPIQLGRVIARAKGSDNAIEAVSEELGEKVIYHIPDLPYPYFRGKNGGIYRTMDDDDDDGLLVYEYDFYLVERLHDKFYGESAWFKLHLPYDGVREFIARTSDLLTKDKARQILVDAGIVASNKQLDIVIDYIVTCIKSQQKNKKASMMQKQYGWNPGPVEDKNKILIGNREISAFGIKYTPVSRDLDEINPTLHKKGSYELWKKAVTVYEKPGMELRAFGFLCAFGSLLMPFLKQREKASIVNLYNPESGQGKTSILQMMTSVYGNPDIDAKLINIWGDTENSIVNRLGYMNNLATAVDEMTDVKPEALHSFLKFIASGRGKNRLGSGGTNKERQNDTTFNLICVVSSNTDFRTVVFSKKAKASGDIARFFQIFIDFDKTMTKEEADNYYSLIFDNYGHAGEIYSQYIIANIDQIKQQLEALQKKIDKELKIPSQDRKFSALFAAVFLGAMISKKLGIHNISIEPIYKAVALEYKKGKDEVIERDFNAVQTLADFLLSSKSATLVVNNNSDNRTGLQEAPILRPTLDLRVRIEPDTKTIYIPVSIMRDYLKTKEVEYTDFVQGLKEKNILKKTTYPKVMHKGLEISAPAVRCIWIDNTGFEELQPENLDLDIPRNVN